jgi:FAD/FMN-containing dehydrogenase
VAGRDRPGSRARPGRAGRASVWPATPLGGGLGFLARRYGLAANSVTAAELVTPGGDLVRADADHEPDLLWAVRGGGGVGVVTALEMRLYPVRELYAGDLFFPNQRAAEVLHAWREWTATVPDEVTSIGHLLRVPSLPEVPNRCAAGPSPSSRLPTSVTRAPVPS